ncbi:MAG: hypothetical protein ACKOQ4_16085 [Mycobacterium sp.]
MGPLPGIGVAGRGPDPPGDIDCGPLGLRLGTAAFVVGDGDAELEGTGAPEVSAGRL